MDNENSALPPEQPVPGLPQSPELRKPPESFGQAIFLGPEGLRSGWGFLLYALMFLAVLFLLSGITRAAHPRANQLWLLALGEFELLLAAIVPAFVMARIEKRSLDVYGLPFLGGIGKLFWIGALWGLVGLTILILAMRGAGVFYFGQLALHGSRILKFAAFWAVFFLIVGLVEEFLLRGYTQYTLTRGIGFWPAAILLSCAFGGVHLFNKGELWIGALAAAAIGLFFCLTLRRIGNLWFAIGFHASWDWGETYLYSVPNSGNTMPGQLLKPSFQGSPWLSGGTVGPEGSLFCFAVILILWVAFDRLYPEVKYKP